MTTLPLSAFFLSLDTWKYIGFNLSFANFLHPSMPGVFTKNLDGPEVNGALWTIKVEIMFYLLVPGIARLSRRFGRWQTLGTIFGLSFAYHIILSTLHHDLLAKQLPGQLCFFVLGSIIYYNHASFLRYKRWMWIISLCTGVAYFVVGGWALETVMLPLITLCCALLLPHIQGPTKYGDFSYGLYVFHYPIIQTLIALGIFGSHPWFATTIVFTSALLLAAGSWHFIESPSLLLAHSPRL